MNMLTAYQKIVLVNVLMDIMQLLILLTLGYV